MSIIVNESTNQFYLHTEKTSYVFEVVGGLLAHSYWGKQIKTAPRVSELQEMYADFSPTDLKDCVPNTSNVLSQEFPTYGSADLRTPAFHAVYSDGSHVSKFEYKGYKIFDIKPKLSGLPSAYVNDDETCHTLEVELFDSLKKITAYLYYSVFEEKDIITRSVKIVNNSEKAFTIKSIKSFCADFADMNYDMVNLNGAWARETHIERKPLFVGMQEIDSKNGASGHNHNPFLAIAEKNANEEYGDVYGLSFVYSGNFFAGVDVDRYYHPRVLMGLNPFNFEWQMKPGDEFQAPEVVMSYSFEGFGGMSRQFHKFIRKNICRGKFRDIERPVLVNNWEATYMNFNEEKLLAIADAGKELGIDMLVLDDGWFGKRNSDNSSLGDWYVNKDKLHSGLKGLGDKLAAKGLKFGLWFEPEMVSPDSDLYRAHPDWCLHTQGRPRTESRNQLTLDLTRKDVCDYIINSVAKILNENPISYVKWDMNRHFSEAGSAQIPAENQREVPHRYMLGLYSILEKLTESFPNILFEGCSGGGGRYDLGILSYMPQNWCSDDTDAVERLYIQEGTTLVYPYCTMGAHISAVPNHQVGRTTPIKFRGEVALTGQFGFELDLSKMKDDDKEKSKELIAFYKKYREVFHNGDVYKLVSVYDNSRSVIEFISEDKETIIVNLYNIKGMMSTPPKTVRLKGLDPSAEYIEVTNENDAHIYGGDVLMNLGIHQNCEHDYTSEIRIFKKASK